MFLGEKHSYRMLFFLAIAHPPWPPDLFLWTSQSSCFPSREDSYLGGAEPVAGAAVQWLLGFRVPHCPRLQWHDLWHLWSGPQSGSCPEEWEQCAGTKECGSECSLAPQATVRVSSHLGSHSCMRSPEQMLWLFSWVRRGAFSCHCPGFHLRKARWKWRHLQLTQLIY